MWLRRAKDVRDTYLGRVVKGKTFADVGGLWGVVNEKVSVAHRLGAKSLTMVDVQLLDNQLWHSFHERMRELKIGGYRTVSGDICKLSVDEVGGPFDVVHCSGVLYHLPDPLRMLENLRKITRSHLVLTSAITREKIKNRAGRYRVPPSGAIFVPALSERERAVLKAYWAPKGVAADGITEPATFSLEDFGPWWWLPTSTALVAMCQSAGFKLVAGQPSWNGDAYTVLLQ